jgi:polyisoprenyl-phosphate glycosyltransferase
MVVASATAITNRDGVFLLQVSVLTRNNVTKLSIVSPCFNERSSLRPLYAEIVAELDGAGIDWEWVVVDDHSSDGSYEELTALSRSDPRVRAIRLAGNAGSHIAMFCGLDYATGDCAAVLTSDLEDPPAVLVSLVQKWSEGYKVVWASRDDRRTTGWFYNMLARAYYFMLRRIIAIRQMPKNGADFFLIDRAALNMVRAYRDRNISLYALIGWLDFPNAIVPFKKRKRRFGTSKWSFGRRAKGVVDTITAFSHVPIRAMSVMGAALATMGFLFAIYVVIEYFLIQTWPGWTSITVLVLVIGGLQMLMLGMLGEYVVRMLDEVRPRPRYMIERMSFGYGGAIPEDAVMLTPPRPWAERPMPLDDKEVVREAGE